MGSQPIEYHSFVPVFEPKYLTDTNCRAQATFIIARPVHLHLSMIEMDGIRWTCETQVAIPVLMLGVQA